MTHALIKNGLAVRYPYSLENLRADNPNVSFSQEVPDERLAEWDVFPVEQIKAPIAAPGQVVIRQLPENINGVWTESWLVREATTQEIAEQGDIVRQQRNELLKGSDWTQVLDAPVNRSEWIIYRQALRDITSQNGFPFNITWPTPPKE